jgi:hypothetical protein
MQVHHDGDHSLACLDSSIKFDSFFRRRSLNLLLKYSFETTKLSAGRPSGAKYCSSRTQSRSLAAGYKNSCAFALHMAKTQDESHLRGRDISFPICPPYAWPILSESLMHVPGICLAYAFRFQILPAPPCSDWVAAEHGFWVARVFNDQRSTQHSVFHGAAPVQAQGAHAGSPF